MLEITKTRTLAAALAATAIAAPSAAAMPIDAGRAAGQAPRPATQVVQVRAHGFDWGDAGIGAAAMLSVLGVGAGVAVAGRRGRRQPAAMG
jgi:hypothetical protein